MNETDPAVRMHQLMVPYLDVRTKPQEIAPELAYEVAAIVIEWGSFENAIDIDIQQLRNWPIVRRLSEVPPQGIKKKLDLWKKSIYTLFSTVPFYKNTAREICSKGKLVSQQRHRLIHGLWQPDQERPGEFRVVSGFDPRQQYGYFQANLQNVRAVHQDIKTMNEAVWSFLVSRMSHAAEGRLVARAVPSRGHQAPRNPATVGTPSPRPKRPRAKS